MIINAIKVIFFLLLSLKGAFSLQANAAILQIKPSERLSSNSSGTIEICWFGQTHSETLGLRQRIQIYLTRELSERAGLKIEFWESCLESPSPFSPIGIAFYDALDNSEGIQNSIAGTTSGSEFPGHPTTYSRGNWNHQNLLDIVLSSHFRNVNPTLVQQAEGLSENGSNHLMESIALHEILHALGFRHEQDHSASTCLEAQERSTRKNLEVTEYDPNSIMNYCLTHSYDFEKSAIPLSRLDIIGIQKIYLPQ